MKKRAPQGELRNLSHTAREQLHTWFREQDGTITLAEIQSRLKEHFDISVSQGSLSVYHNEHYSEINPPNESEQDARSRVITIRIEIPAGCNVNVSTTREQREPR